MQMNYVDIILVVVILLSVWSGVQRGFIIGILELLAWVGGIVAAFVFYPYLMPLMGKLVDMEGIWVAPLSFLVALILARIILSYLVQLLLNTVSAETHRHIANKALGVVPGMLNGLIWAAIISILFLFIPLWKGLPEETRKSKIAGRVSVEVEKLENKLSPVFDKAMKYTMSRLMVEPSSDKFVKLPYTVDDAEPRPDLEAEMLVMINEERTKMGLHPLESDTALRRVARLHSQDMFARGYFSHYTPEQKDPFDRIRAGGIPFLAAGENLALARTLPVAHSGLMHSPGHRANILQRSFGRVGIGILDGGIYGLMITQNFRN